MSEPPINLDLLLPLAARWVLEQEQRIIREGRALTEPEQADARRIGVREVGKVRILEVPEIPPPEEPALAEAAATAGFLQSTTSGLTLRYGIYIRAGCAERRLIAHELAHVEQYERLGGIAPFLQRYFMEYLLLGYRSSPLEQEAAERAARIVGDAGGGGDQQASRSD